MILSLTAYIWIPVLIAVLIGLCCCCGVTRWGNRPYNPNPPPATVLVPAHMVAGANAQGQQEQGQQQQQQQDGAKQMLGGGLSMPQSSPLDGQQGQEQPAIAAASLV